MRERWGAVRAPAVQTFRLDVVKVTARLDSGITPGLVVVDSNRPAYRRASGASSLPASMPGNAGGLLKQFIATH